MLGPHPVADLLIGSPNEKKRLMAVRSSFS